MTIRIKRAHRTSLALCCAVAAAFAAACGGSPRPSPTPATERFAEVLGHTPTGLAATIAARGVLVVANADDYPPQSYVDDKGKLVGFDVDVAAAVAKALGVQLKFVNPTWDAVPAGLRKGRFDVSIGSLAIGEGLARLVDFTQPYYYMPARVAVKKGAATLEDAAALAGKKIGVGLQTVYLSWLQANTRAIVKGYPTDADAFSDLESGRLDGVMAAGPTLDQALEAGKPFTVSRAAFFWQRLAFAVRKGQPDLRAAFNLVISRMRRGGTLAELSKRWFAGSDLSVKP